MAKKVFIGVGHGGSDPGAVSGSFKESSINLVMALACKKELERHGVKVSISRTIEENDKLADEIKECKAFAPDVAIEIHCNAGSPTADGFEVYTQTGAQKAKSKKLAESIWKRVESIGQNAHGSSPYKTKLNSSGTDYFGWLRQLTCPAVLLEGFFVDGVKDRQGFDTVAEQQAMGVAYAHGVLDYLGIKVKAAATSSNNKEKMCYVQIFAGSRAGAEVKLKEAKAAGFKDAFIKCE